MSKIDIEFEANKFRNNNGMSLFEAINLDSLLLKLKILTAYMPLSEEFSGLCLFNSKYKFILVNSAKPIGRQNYTIAHEFFHLYIEKNFQPHICGRDNKDSISEKNADKFASAFLMPKEAVLGMIDSKDQEGNLSLGKVIQLQHYFSVSRKAMLIRLKELKLIKQDLLNEYYLLPAISSARENGFDTKLYSQPKDFRIIGDYGLKVKQLLDENKISEGHYLELMNKISNYEK